jgi:hypothetical protein
MAKFDLFKIIRREARNNQDPKGWIKSVRESLIRHRVSEDELLKMITHAQSGSIPKGTLEVALNSKILGYLNLTEAFPISLKLTTPIKFEINPNGKVGVCPSSEPRHREILGLVKKHPENTENPTARRGFVILCENKPIGYIKFYGSRSFLAFENLADHEGNLIFIRGMLYAVSDMLIYLLERISLHQRKSSDWYGVNVENLIELGIEIDFTPQRFIEDKSITETLSRAPAQIGENVNLRVIHIPKENLTSLYLNGAFVDDLLSR